MYDELNIINLDLKTTKMKLENLQTLYDARNEEAERVQKENVQLQERNKSLQVCLLLFYVWFNIMLYS